MAHPGTPLVPSLPQHKIGTPIAVRSLFLIGVLSVCLSLCPNVLAETAEFTQNSPNSNTMSLEVPLGGYPGRGASLPISLYYSSRVWRVGFIRSIYSSYGLPRSAAEAIYAEHSTAGWTTSLDVPKVEWPKYNDVYWFDGKAYPRGPVATYTYRVARVYIHMPDGSTHEFRESDQAYPASNGIDMWGTFYAVDGSRMRYDSTGETTGILYLADGTRYILNGSTAQYIDRNGNTLNYDGSTRQWFDTLGRTLGQPLLATPSYGDFAYVIPGQNGGTVTYTMKWRNLGDVLTQAQALKCASDYYLPNPDQPPTNYDSYNFPQMASASSLFTSGYANEDQETSYTYVVGRGQAGSNVFNPIVLSEIVLPNGQSYKFTYNINGEIEKVIFPMGAYQRYQHSQITPISHATVPYDQGSRGVTSRWVSPNGTGGSDEALWQYQTSLSAGSYLITNTAPNGTRTETYLYPAGPGTNTFGHELGTNGQAKDIRVYAPISEGGAMLRRTLFEYASTSTSFTRPSPGTGTYTANRNTRAVKTVNLILDMGGPTLASAMTTQYDTTYQFTVGPDTIQTAEYAYTLVDQTAAQTSAIGAIPLGNLIRSNETAFLTWDGNYRTRNILGLVTSTIIKDAAGTIVGWATFTYDEPAYPLIQYGSVTGWTDPLTIYRGNVTTVSRWLDQPTPMWAATHTQFDQCGSIKNSWDALGRLSQIDYSPTYAYAYGTTATSVVPDPSGTYGQPTSLVSTSAYDLNTGLLMSRTEANNRTTTYEYNDPLYRVTKVTRPDGGWTITSYSDVAGNNYIRSQTLQHTTPSQQVTDGYQFFDMAGRASRSFAKEETTYLTVDTQYDNMGRVWRVSNPYRTAALTDPVNPSGLWTTTGYDSLSRSVMVTTPDNAQAKTSYGANLTSPYIGTTATTTDQTIKARKSITDAQGRLIQVIEDPNGLAYETNYAYDVLNNLRKVEQGNQLRYFGYDSFSRVIRARNVEQTVNASLAWTDPVMGNSAWTVAIAYDLAGNLLSRTDARNITTNFTYDGLNRVKTVRYVNDPQSTPGIDNYYDGYRGGAFQSIPDSKGRLWQAETSGQVRTTVDTFDVLGRVHTQRQQFWAGSTWSSSYQVQHSYSLAGQLLSLTYPSGRSVSYEYDKSGRLKTFAGNLGDGVSRTYANEFQYSEWSGLQQEKFGTATALYHKQRFNQRGQLWDVRLSTVAYATDPANGDRGAVVNYYSANYTQGGSGSDNNGQVVREENSIPGSNFFQQTYVYDVLNRLTSVNEKLNGTGADSFKQAYTYDRFGNRSIHLAQTTTNVARPNYTVDANTNRLTAPAGYTYAYDAAGNQTNDTYTGGGQRVFDAENRMISAQGGGQWQYYKYSGSGKRVRRLLNGVETWQVYGISGDLLAEYAAIGAPASPQKEYGYRNGQLLITAEPWALSAPPPSATTAAPSTSGPSVSLNWSAASGATNYRVERKGAGGAYVLAGTTSSTNLVDSGASAGSAYLYKVCAADGAGNCTSTFSNVALGTAMAFTDPSIMSINDDPTGATATTAKIEHITELRSAVNAVRSLASLAPATWTNPNLTRYVSLINSEDIRDLRTKLDEALTALSIATSAYDDPRLAGAPNGTAIKKVHITQLRQRSTSGIGGSGGAVSQINLQWLVADHLGTPRMIADASGTLAGIKRHDYLPFGEEIDSVSGRSEGQGYVVDSTRQKFTGYEADIETGLKFAQARYQSSVQGRFISVDPLGASAITTAPQSFNRYAYVLNNPVNFTDPSGMMPMVDASMSYGEVSGLWAGGSLGFGGPETGRSIIAAAESRFDAGVREAVALKAFNDAFRKGDMAACRRIVAANPSVGYEMNSSYNPNAEGNASGEREVKVAEVALLEGVKEDSPIAARGSQDLYHKSRYNLDLNQGGVDYESSIFTISVTFVAYNLGDWDRDSVKVGVSPNGRWKLVETLTGIPPIRKDWSSDRVTILLNVRARDLTAPNTLIKVQASAFYTSLYRMDGKAGIEQRSVTGEAYIKLQIGRASSTIREVP